MQLKTALKAIEPIKQLCLQADNPALNKIADQLNPCQVISEKIEQEIYPDPPTVLLKGHVIREGVNDELDELRDMAHSGKKYLQKFKTEKAN